MDKISRDSFDYLSQLRQNPKIAIKPLQDTLQYFKGNVLNLPGAKCGLMTQEGTAAVQGNTIEGGLNILECIKYLQNQKPLGALTWADGLTHSAKDHSDDIGPKGIAGHDGSDGSHMKDRIERYGSWMGTIGENISFGQNTGQDVILQLIVDDGVATRGHRTNCFNPSFNVVGVSSNTHKVYGSCTVMDLAGGYTFGKEAVSAKAQTKINQQVQQQAPQLNQAQTKQDMPEGCVKWNTSTSTSTSNGKKTTVVKTIYTMADGSTQTSTQTSIEG